MIKRNLFNFIKSIIDLFENNDKKKLLIVTIVQVMLAFFDLIGLLTIGLLGAVVINGIQSQSLVGNHVLEALNIDSSSIQIQVAVLGAIVAVVFSLKTVASIVLTQRVLLFISKRGALISKNILISIFSKPIILMNKYTHQEIIYGSTTGVVNIIIRVVGSIITIVSDVALLIVIFAGLLILNPIVSISALIMFMSVSLIINKLLKSKLFDLGSEEVDLNLKSNEAINELLNTYRESIVRNTRLSYLNRINSHRIQLANIDATRIFLPKLNKFLIEITMVIGILAVAGLQFYFYTATEAIANLAIFLAAVTRIAPAVLRIQQSYLAIQNGAGASQRTLEIISEINVGLQHKLINQLVDFKYEGFIPNIRVSDLSFSYLNSEEFVLANLDFEIFAGEQVAIVGSSGAGKSTLVDLLLGVQAPTVGKILISSDEPLSTIDKWPGAIAYVPQDIMIINGSVRDNIKLGFEFNASFDSYIWDALKLSRIDKLVLGFPNKLDTKLGENGYKLSGGEAQRIGIARALFTKPKLLVLDEATSALDSQTEQDITEALKFLKPNTTVIMIAHRLSTVRNADKVIFMEKGLIKCIGSFDQVRNKVPDFDKQANLMGL
jgi:ABC-type multidrug transport system fused ATPase/permease subunit